MSSPENAPTGYHAGLRDALHANVPMSGSPDSYEPRPINEMTDSEKLDEILLTMRTVGKALEAFTNSGAGQMMGRLLMSRK